MLVDGANIVMYFVSTFWPPLWPWGWPSGTQKSTIFYPRTNVWRQSRTFCCSEQGSKSLPAWHFLGGGTACRSTWTKWSYNLGKLQKHSKPTRNPLSSYQEQRKYIFLQNECVPKILEKYFSSPLQNIFVNVIFSESNSPWGFRPTVPKQTLPWSGLAIVILAQCIW